MASIFNTAPIMEEINTSEYEFLKEFMIWNLTEIESRQPFYDNEFMNGSYDLRIFWIQGTKTLGYALMDDWKAKKMRWFRVGIKEDWNNFRHAVQEANSHDNS